ncbi:MAG: hypothetical protein P8074_20950 [Anaerolineales bacterium]
METLASFRVTIPGQETPVNALGLWQVAVEEATTGDQAGSLWRAELPGEPLEAGQALDFQEAQLGRVRLALGTVESRLSADLKNLPGPDAAADYALRATALLEAEPGSPSSVLATAAQTRWPEASYAVFDRLPLDARQLEEAGQAVGRFATQVQQTVSQFARVETVIGGRMVGVTRVAWSGEIETRWSARFDPDQYQQHTRVLAHALATRQDWLRFLLLVTGGAARIGAALASGPFSLLTLWTTWNYLKQVLAQYSQLR